VQKAAGSTPAGPIGEMTAKNNWLKLSGQKRYDSYKQLAQAVGPEKI